MEIEYSEIVCTKVGKVYLASCTISKPIKSEVNMQGKTEEIAKEKLNLFLAGKPYSHLDK